MKKDFIKLHISIFLAGFTAIFGKLISLNEVMLVWYRMLITSIILILVFLLFTRLKALRFKDAVKVTGTGVILAVHWVFFYGSIKASNVSLGVVCFSTIGFFTAILEPVVNRKPFSLKEIFFSFIALSGIILIFHFDTQYRIGIIMGIISSALAALFTVYNKKISTQYPPFTILTYQISGGFVVLSLVVPVYLYFVKLQSYIPTKLDIVWLMIFCIICTILVQLLHIQILQKLSAFTLSLSFNLEPIYSITLAAILFNEAKSFNASFYAGIALIVFSVFLQTVTAAVPAISAEKSLELIE